MWACVSQPQGRKQGSRQTSGSPEVKGLGRGSAECMRQLNHSRVRPERRAADTTGANAACQTHTSCWAPPKKGGTGSHFNGIEFRDKPNIPVLTVLEITTKPKAGAPARPFADHRPQQQSITQDPGRTRFIRHAGSLQQMGPIREPAEHMYANPSSHARLAWQSGSISEPAVCL